MTNDSNENNRTVFTFGQDVIVNGQKAKIIQKAGEGRWTIDINGMWYERFDYEISVDTPTDKKTTADCLKEITEIAELEGLCPDGIWNEKALNILDGFLSLRIAELREKAEKGLPDKQEMRLNCPDQERIDTNIENLYWYNGAEWMKEKATSILLAKEQEMQEKEREIERLRKELEEAKKIVLNASDYQIWKREFHDGCGRLPNSYETLLWCKEQIRR